MKKNIDILLQRYCDVAEMLSKMFDPYLEVIVHDLRKPEKSILSIYNGHITGRKVGDSTSDLGFKRAKGETPDLMINYKNISPQNKPLKSSSLTIRDDDGEIVGALSFNFDISIFHSIKTILDTFTKTQESDYIDEKELFKPHSIQAEIKQVLDTIILKNGWSQSHLSRQKKQQLIGQLNQQHIFHKKGSFSIVAQELSLSIPTVYTYLKKWKQDHNE